MNLQPQSNYGTSVTKAFSILEFLSKYTEPQNVTKIADGTNMSKSTAYKLLQTLQKISVVERDKDTPTYRIGVGILKLAYAYLADNDHIVKLTEPYLRTLNKMTGETIHLGLLKGDSVVYLSKLESPQAVRMHSSIGNTSPLYCTGLGKAILSIVPDGERDRYLNHTQLVRYTSKTIIDKQLLRKNIEKTRTIGYAVDNAEHSEGVRCVAVALQIQRGVYIGLSVSAPEYRLNDEILQKYSQLLLDTKESIASDVKL